MSQRSASDAGPDAAQWIVPDLYIRTLRPKASKSQTLDHLRDALRPKCCWPESPSETAPSRPGFSEFTAIQPTGEFPIFRALQDMAGGVSKPSMSVKQPSISTSARRSLGPNSSGINAAVCGAGAVEITQSKGSFRITRIDPQVPAVRCALERLNPRASANIEFSRERLADCVHSWRGGVFRFVGNNSAAG